jgi:hypothetical protein
MLDEGLRRRLEMLNRSPLSGEAAQAVPPRRAVSPLRPGAVQPLAKLLHRGSPVANAAGEHLLVQIPLEELWPGGSELVVRRHAQMPASAATQPTGCEMGELAAFLAAIPYDLLLLDLETCGLAGSALFLVGLLRWVENRLTVELLLARNYNEERAVLVSLWERIQPTTLLVTFNGKSFDWPMVLDRTARYRLFPGSLPFQPRHVDVLHHARRRWGRQFGNCRLQTLERHICGRSRSGDIPGSQIPAAYQQFVRTGATAKMDPILQHNAIDLVTLLDLAMRLAD